MYKREHRKILGRFYWFQAVIIIANEILPLLKSAKHERHSCRCILFEKVHCKSLKYLNIQDVDAWNNLN
jgi:hypothetical protein